MINKLNPNYGSKSQRYSEFIFAMPGSRRRKVTDGQRRISRCRLSLGVSGFVLFDPTFLSVDKVKKNLTRLFSDYNYVHTVI
jgi:hypothetical protein